MTEQKVWIITGTWRGLGADAPDATLAPGTAVIVAEEPSHIHIPRPSRGTRSGIAAQANQARIAEEAR